MNDLRCQHCGSTNLTSITPYWSRCGNCGEVTYTPQREPTVALQAVASTPAAGTRRLYGAETVPLPVRSSPRRRLIAIALGFVAAGLYAASAPLALYFIALELGVDISEVLLLSKVSLIATLWIFQSVAFTIVGLYSSFLVLRKKSEAGAGWITFGIFSTSLSAVFIALGRLTGAYFGIASGLIVFGAGFLNIWRRGLFGRRKARGMTETKPEGKEDAAWGSTMSHKE